MCGLFLTSPALAEDIYEPTDASSDPEEITATDLGVSQEQVNSATKEETVSVVETGMLIEIGNTTADETTVIVRVTDKKGKTEDKTLEIDQTEVDLETADGTDADLSDWIAGDQLTYTALENTNSGSINATKVRNRSFRQFHRGKNGWITAIREDAQEVDVDWANKIFTLDVSEARMVAGNVNPASITDLHVGDRIRARVQDDGDQNSDTWDANILVVLRRGKTLFMRVTRWVVPARITELDEDPVIPTTMTVEILPSKFFEEGDVNNLIGAPGHSLKVYVDENTKLRRRYFGKSLISEFSEGDRLQIIGRLSEATDKLDAKFIRNANIQVLGVARRIGNVLSVDASKGQITANVVNTARRWRIDVSDNTKIYKQGKEISLSDIQVSDKIRVFGTVNRRLRIIVAKRMAVLVPKSPPMCENTCGNSICDEVVCQGENCPCAETFNSCPADCAATN